jgi:hypothetical protein
VAAVQNPGELRLWRLPAAAGVAALVAALGVAAVAAGDPGQLASAYRSVADRMTETYRLNGVSEIPARIVRSFVSPRPWVFSDVGAEGWYRALYPGMWVLYVAYPLAALGAWRMRRRPELLLIGICILAVLAVHAVLSGSGVRQRSTVEPLLAVLVVAACPSWRLVAEAASAGALLVSLVAVFDGASLGVVAMLVAAGVVIGFVSRRLTDRRLELDPDPRPLRAVLDAWGGRDALTRVKPRLRETGR